MKSIVDLFQNFKSYKDIGVEDWTKIKEYYQAFFTNHKYPRFFQSYLYLKSERRYFFYGWIWDCFVLVKKKKEFGNKVFYLCLPPIHKNGDVAKELELIETLRLQGVKTKLSDEDIEIYNYSRKLYRKDKDNIEHIYDVEDFADLKKPGYKKFRYYYKKFLKYQEEKTIELSIVDKLSNVEMERNELLLKNWAAYKKMVPDQCHLYFNETEPNVFFQLLNKKGSIITSSITEDIGGQGLITTNYSDYNYQIKDFQSNRALHWIVMNYWREKNIKYLNSGSGGWDLTLTKHKQELNPCKQLQIYDTKIEDKLTEEEYQLMCRENNK